MKDLFGFRRTNQGSWRGQLGRRPRRKVSMQGARRGGQVMGMLAASGQRFRNQTGGGLRGGCSNPLSFNYDPQATCDDGSCQFLSLDHWVSLTNPPLPDACMIQVDPIVCPYQYGGNSSQCEEWWASTQYGSQEAYWEQFQQMVQGLQDECDAGLQAMYDEEMTLGGGATMPSCNPGCMDTSADNYNPSANQDGGNCVYGGSVSGLSGKKDPKRGKRFNNACGCGA
jgi:hypothetical protein